MITASETGVGPLEPTAIEQMWTAMASLSWGTPGTNQSELGSAEWVYSYTPTLGSGDPATYDDGAVSLDGSYCDETYFIAQSTWHADAARCGDDGDLLVNAWGVTVKATELVITEDCYGRLVTDEDGVVSYGSWTAITSGSTVNVDPPTLDFSPIADVLSTCPSPGVDLGQSIFVYMELSLTNPGGGC